MQFGCNMPLGTFPIRCLIVLPHYRFRMKRLLIVEVDGAAHATLQQLAAYPYHLSFAANDIDNVASAIAEQPDAILSPSISCLQAIRSTAVTQHLLFIFLGVPSGGASYRQAMEAGADDYIPFPFSMHDLHLAIQARMQRVATLQKTAAPASQNGHQLSGKKTLLQLAEAAKAQLYARKDIVYKELANPRYLYYILKGRVRTCKVHSDGKKLVIGLFKEGDLLGYTALLNDIPYTHTAEAMEPATIAAIPKAAFEAAVHDNPMALRYFLYMMANRLIEKERRLVDIAYNTLRKKVANALMALSQTYHVDKASHFLIDLTREELAHLAGTATESLSRTLTTFREEQLVDILPGGEIAIIDDKRLQTFLR